MTKKKLFLSNGSDKTSLETCECEIREHEMMGRGGGESVMTSNSRGVQKWDKQSQNLFEDKVREVNESN